MRLVKDNKHTFHFQWDKPLKEERIILVRYSGRDGGDSMEYVAYFPAGAFVSSPVTQSAFRAGDSWVYIRSVELLAAEMRTEVAVPARLHTIENGLFQVYGDQVILREHPFFREYHVGEPSRLTLEFTPWRQNSQSPQLRVPSFD